jgi:hypothetical protein
MAKRRHSSAHHYSSNDHRKELSNTTANEVDIGGGVVLEGDIVELYEQMDILLANYGMGGCRSLEEYRDMVEHTDPALLTGLMVCMGDRKMLEAGEDPDKGKAPYKSTPVSEGKPSGEFFHNKVYTGGECDMTDFLVKSGADWKDLQKFKNDLASGKTKMEIKDFSKKFNTDTLLHDKDFNLQKTIDEMLAYRDKSKNYTFSINKVKF